MTGRLDQLRADVEAGESETLEFKRSGADGEIEVNDAKVRVEVKLGLLLSAMSGSIKREIEKALDEYLA